MAEDLCNTNLGLAIEGGYRSPATQTSHRHKLKPSGRLRLLFPSCGNEGEEDEDVETASMDSKNSETYKRKTEDCDSNHGMRKKLRLTEDQTTLLKESFRGSNALTAMKKLELSEKLGLRPRQVEVWFQNRRARTKVKQTEVDCEELKRWCWNLIEENKRLKRELQELRFCGLNLEAKRECPSCEKNDRVLKFCN